MFVTIDGPNCVGKSTIVEVLAASLQEREVDVCSLKQPSDSKLGNFVRQSERDFRGMSLAALVVADRLMQVEREIRPALIDGKTVICDRYIASTLVLQRIDGVDASVLWEMNADVLLPDLSVVLLASADTLEARLDARPGRSRFERLPDIAETEISYFRDAADSMTARGLHVLIIDTEPLTIDEVVERVERAIARG